MEVALPYICLLIKKDRNKMKKIIITFIVGCLFIIPASAQVRLGVEAGMNLSHFKYSQSGKTQKVDGMKPGFQIGVTADYEFEKHWMLITGVSFMQTHSNMKLATYTNAFYFPNTEIKLNHLTIPLKVGYNIHINDNLSLIPSVGWYGSINFSAGNASLKYIDGDEIRHTNWKPMDGYSYEISADLPHPITASVGACRHWTYGATGELKAIIRKHYTVGFSYYEDIKKVQKQNDLRNYGFQLSVGYKF